MVCIWFTFLKFINLQNPNQSVQSQGTYTVAIYACFLNVFPYFSESDILRLTLVSENVSRCSCTCQWWASITSTRPVVRNCVGGVSTGSTGHSPGLSNEGNTTLPHTNTLHSHLQSQAPLPTSITARVIDLPSTLTVPEGLQAINAKNI